MQNKFSVEARFTGSETWQNRADHAIAQGALTNSKRPSCFVEGVYPTHLTHGQGAFVWDTDKKKYIDFICGLGSSILGYADAGVTKAVSDMAAKGPSLPLSSTLEVEVAEQVKGVFTFIDKLRFLKTGSDACSAAIKIARAYTGVSDESEVLSALRIMEIHRDLLEELGQAGWPTDSLQIMRQGLPKSAESDGNKALSPRTIFENGKRQEHGTSSFAEEAGTNQESGSKQGVLHGSTSLREEALRDLWKDTSPGSSHRLLKAFRREVALRFSSLAGAQKRIILTDGYHGHNDPFVSLSSPHLGVPSDPTILELSGNMDLIPCAAAVIIEPIVTVDSKTRQEYLMELRKKCDEAGTLLIFDEVITGFRVPLNSVTRYYGVTPDLVCLGKSIANGFPVSVVGGRRDVMDCGEYFISSTFAGEMCSLAAAKETIHQLTTRRDLKYLWEKGKQFQASFNSVWGDGIWIEGYPTRGVFKAKDELTKALFFQECCLAGILVGSSFFFNYSHTDEVVYSTSLQLFRDIVTRIKTGGIELKGQMPKSPFAQQMRENK